MVPDIANYLALEVKRELAERYFSMRRLIEDDTQQLTVQIREHLRTIEQRVCLDLLRIYRLLQHEELIREFLALTGLSEAFFFDPYLLISPTIRARAFIGVKPRGLTRAGRFKNLVIDGYETLERNVERCREAFGKLTETRETLEETIRIFHLRNDIGAILNFLRGLDDERHGLGGETGVNASSDLATKLHIELPPSLENIITRLPPIAPLPRIKRPLLNITERAWRSHGRELLEKIGKLY